MKEGREEFSEVLKGMLSGDGFSPIIARTLRFFLDNPYESLVIVNLEGKLEFMDRGSEKFFGLPEGGARGVQIKELIPDSVLPRVLETGTPVIGRVLKVKGDWRITSAYPLVRDGKLVGAIGRLFFRSFEEVERINREVKRLKKEVKSLREMHRRQHDALYTFENILGVSTAIKGAIELAKKIAMVETDVFITGESGTGKELFAQAIHNFINPKRPFVRVNSPAIPFDLAESELFGYERGAFSGASTTGKQGKFELAKNGTIFLDEISSLPLSIQAKLLRTLQEREIERLGSTQIRRVNFRMIAASNMDLKRAVKDGKFREDLYYRIAKATIQISPLRQRTEDIPIYVGHFLKAINDRFGTLFKKLSDEALACFLNYKWPGNVRELINMLEQASLKKWEGELIPKSCLPDELCNSSPIEGTSPSSVEFKEGVKKTEKMLILQALEQTGGNKRKAAFILSMPRSTFYKKIDEHGIEL